MNTRIFLRFFSAVLLVLSLFNVCAYATESAMIPERDPLLGTLTDAEIFPLGERMYRQGLLPSGEIMEAYVSGDILIDSTSFSCSHCHQRAGLGSFEGGIITPPTTGNKLYQTYQRPPSLHDVVDKNGRYTYAKTITRRPAYTRDEIKAALESGVDPSGEVFNGVMPIYPLDQTDMAILVRYLELLSAEPSPGASPYGFKFATIITDDVSSADREELLTPLKRFISVQNNQVSMYRNFIKFGYQPTGDMKYSFRSASLDVWELKGDPATWGDQLAAYYNARPVFAVLGGISNQSWQPIHDFCEARQLPCFYPITNLPVVSDHDWYTLYFNKGYYQEGEAVARFLKQQKNEEGPILQLVQETDAGRALLTGFNAGRLSGGEAPVETLILSSRDLKDPLFLSRLLDEKQPGTLLLWGDEQFIPALKSLTYPLSDETALFVSSTALGTATLQLPDTLRPQIFITWPYRLTPYFGDIENLGILARVPTDTTYKDISDRRITSRTAVMMNQSVLQGLRLLYGDLQRDYMLDVLGMQMDQVARDYERLSFGPGQRYSSKGCYIMQLGPGPEPELLPQSDWVIH